MAKSPKRTVLEKKVKKKRWIAVLAPEMFNSVVVGEMPLVAPQAAMGRAVSANLMNITHDLKQQSITVLMRVNEVKENQALTMIESFKIMPTAMKRMTHRRMEIIEDSSIYVTSDNVRVRIKPVLFTRGNTTNSVKHALRKGMRNIVLRNVKSVSVNELFRDALSNKLQFTITKDLNKLYPLKKVVIRELSLEKERTRKKSTAVETEVEVPVSKRGKKSKEEAQFRQPAPSEGGEEIPIPDDADASGETPAGEPSAETEFQETPEEPEFQEIPEDEPEKE